MSKRRQNVASGPWRLTLDGLKVRSQGRVVARCENGATANLLRVVPEMIEVLQQVLQSGTNIDRPAIERLLASVQNGGAS